MTEMWQEGQTGPATRSLLRDKQVDCVLASLPMGLQKLWRPEIAWEKRVSHRVGDPAVASSVEGFTLLASASFKI